MPAQYPADVYNKDDETLLKFLQGGGAGRGPEVDKAIQDLLKQRGASGFAKQAYDFDPQRQGTSSAVDPLRDPGAYASTGFNTSQATKTQAARTNYFQDFLNSLSPEERTEFEGMGELSDQEKQDIGYSYAAQKQLNFGTPLAKGEYAAAGGLYYTPEWGEYGGYLTKENPDAEQVARVREMMAQQAAGTADPSWANQNLSGLISRTGLGGWHVRGATPEDVEVQKYGIYNVGRSDYRQTRRNQALQESVESLKQAGEPSQEFLADYITQEEQPTESRYGPRGEVLGEIAQNQGPSTPVKYDEQMRQFVPNPGAGRPTNVRLKNPPPLAEKSDVQRERVAQQSEVDLAKEKQLASAKAAETYRQSASNEDPFRSKAIFG